MNRNKMGQRLRELRAGRAAEMVATACGITKTAIYNYELGLRVPRDETKMRLADYYGCTVEELFFDEQYLIGGYENEPDKH